MAPLAMRTSRIPDQDGSRFFDRMATRTDAKVGIQSGQYVKQDVAHPDVRSVNESTSLWNWLWHAEKGAVKEGLLDGRFGAALRAQHDIVGRFAIAALDVESHRWI